MSEAVKPDPWVVREAKEFKPLPVGFYTTLFKGVAEVTMPKDGSIKWRFEWEVKTGEHAGEQASALTDRSISPTTLPGRLIAGLLGRAIVPGENVKDAVDGCKGKTFLVNIAGGPQNGKPCVRSCGKPPAM